MLKLVAVLTAAAGCAAQDLPITRTADVKLVVPDIETARHYYTSVVGLQEAFQSGGATYFKVNDDQFIAVAPAVPSGQPVAFERISFLAPDVRKLRESLVRRGLAPSEIARDSEGSMRCTLLDPEGSRLDFVQYEAGSRQAQSRGKFPGEHPMSDHLLHVGIPVDKPEEAKALYMGKLGFKDFLHGGPNGELRWYNLSIPGTKGDYIELMVHTPDPRAGRAHICFEVPDIQATWHLLTERGQPGKFQPFVALNDRWILNVRDAEGFRVEILGPLAPEELRPKH